MRITTHLMMTFCITSLILTSYNINSASAAISNADNRKQEQINKGSKEQITAFFSNYLADKEETSRFDKPIKLSAIKKQRKIVWDAWKNANLAFSEQKLIGLNKLEEGKFASWKIPENLEPSATMPYYWGSKGEAKPKNGYPLYVYTHGSGPKRDEWRTGLAICKDFDDAPSVYFIPQIPNMGEYYRWWQKSKQFAWERLLRLAFISGDINPNNIYFFGISEGGYGSQRLASFYADYLAGAGPMAGGEPLKNAPAENCRNIAFSLLTGANDTGFYRNKLTQYIKDEFEKLERQNPGSFVHRIELIEGKGHSIDYKPTTPWLKQHTRNPYPKFVSWENFEMDGIYRKGFYNIYVKERSNDDTKSRTYYELSISGNEINLKTDIVTYNTVEKDSQWGIELKFEKRYQPATKGKVVIYLCQELIDLKKEITLTVNGKKAFEGIVQPNLKHLVNSCATFFDPERLYPAAIEVDIADVK